MELDADALETLVQRIQSRSRVAGECTVYTGCLTPHGYPRITWRGKNLYAHRVVHYARTGEWPECVMHTCGNHSCVLPEHLKSGTAWDRCMAREERRKASGVPRARKIDRSTVQKIWTLYKTGDYSQDALAAMFGTTQIIVSNIVTSKNYAQFTKSDSSTPR